MFPKMGKEFPRVDSGERYAAAIAYALNQELGDTHSAIKTVMKWTGATERTVKYWYAGRCGPSGPHLISLARNSSAVFELFLLMAGREHYLREGSMAATRAKLVELIRLIDQDNKH